MPYMKNDEGGMIFANDAQVDAMMAMGYKRCEDPAVVEERMMKQREIDAKFGRHKLYKDGECVFADEGQVALMKSLGYSSEEPKQAEPIKHKKNKKRGKGLVEPDSSGFDLEGFESLEAEEGDE